MGDRGSIRAVSTEHFISSDVVSRTLLRKETQNAISGQISVLQQVQTSGLERQVSQADDTVSPADGRLQLARVHDNGLSTVDYPDMLNAGETGHVVVLCQAIGSRFHAHM